MLGTDKIYSGPGGWLRLSEIIAGHTQNGIIVLVGENTFRYCLPLLRENCNGLDKATIITIQGNEACKTIAGVEKVWATLASIKALRSSLLICLGGGVITDIGGFAAATYKRGMNFIHIPTTLLAMVDAALGGKTGINLGVVKNQIGVFAQPLSVFIFPEFLVTLPERQKLSGFAEMIKHAMIDNEGHFDELVAAHTIEQECNEKAILRSAAVKMAVVRQDYSDSGIRKVLNFGHTIGHAIEALSHRNDAKPLFHGEAVAVGLICECYISMQMLGFPETSLHKLIKLIFRHFPYYPFKKESFGALTELMSHDKKNLSANESNFSLIKAIGKPVFDQVPGEKLIAESLDFYLSLENPHAE